ncbi:hypothetical protein E3N88_33106 [Mikania micrantha]|uniref:CCHC-type domain-containing protein n=1 Tax=Mikania micrantha TaxID=192012 RepID=A0A5N6MB00_9ASTR|nr:hypothetical protein E3N88_33106 [Mikania micrantha]
MPPRRNVANNNNNANINNANNTNANNNGNDTTNAENVEAKSTNDEPSKEVNSESSNASKSNKRKRNGQNFTVVTPTIPAVPLNQQAPLNLNNKPYAGSQPLCNTCRLHHPQNRPCRVCNICGRYGHFAQTCRIGPPLQQGNQTQVARQTNQQPAAPAIPAITNGRACFECGDPNHFRNQCPRLAGNNQGGARARTFQLNVQDAQANQNMENDTLLIKDR